MAILGVLLGMVLSAVVALALIADHRQKETSGLIKQLKEAMLETEARVAFLEKRKALLAETATSQPRPAGVGGQKLRTWNEDAAPAEVTR